MFSRIDSQADTASEMAATWFRKGQQQPQPRTPYAGGGGGKAADKPPKKGAAAEGEAGEKISKGKKRRLKVAEKKKTAKSAAKEESTDDEEAADAPAKGRWPDRPKMETPEWLKCQKAFQEKWPRRMLLAPHQQVQARRDAAPARTTRRMGSMPGSRRKSWQ